MTAFLAMEKLMAHSMVESHVYAVMNGRIHSASFSLTEDVINDEDCLNPSLYHWDPMNVLSFSSKTLTQTGR